MTLQQAQSQWIAWLRTFLTAALFAPVSTMGTLFSFTPDDSGVPGTWSMVRDFVNAFPGGTNFPANFAVLDVNGNPVAMTYAQALALLQMVVGQGMTAWQKFLTLEAQVMAATTVAEVQAVQW